MILIAVFDTKILKENMTRMKLAYAGTNTVEEDDLPSKKKAKKG